MAWQKSQRGRPRIQTKVHCDKGGARREREVGYKYLCIAMGIIINDDSIGDEARIHQDGMNLNLLLNDGNQGKKQNGGS